MNPDIQIKVDYYKCKNMSAIANQFFNDAEKECLSNNCQSYSAMFYVVFEKMCEAIEDLRECQ